MLLYILFVSTSWPQRVVSWPSASLPMFSFRSTYQTQVDNCSCRSMQVKLTGLLGNYDSQAYRPTYQPTVRRFIWKFHRNRGPSCSCDGTYGRFDVFSLFCFQLKWIKWKTFIIPINISHFSAESKRTWYHCIFITTSVIEKGPKKGVSALNVIFPKNDDSPSTPLPHTRA